MNGPLRVLALNRAVGPRAIRVYGYIVEDLSPTEWRPVKVYSVAHGLGIHRQDAGRALRLLVNEGFLERGERDGPGGAWTYRLAEPTPIRHPDS